MSDNIIHLNEAALKGELKNLVRNSVEKTLNELLNHEADWCILRPVTDVDAFQSGRFAKQNGRPETQKFLLTLSV